MSQCRQLSRDWVIVILLLLAAAALRVPHLSDPGYTLDELWTSEIASGRGSLHLHLPVNQVLQPPELFSLQDGPPWWAVWSHMEVTHPPVYFLLLRGWIVLMGGPGDVAERAISVACGLMALALLFDVTRLTSGRSVAVWACLLMIVASPQVDFARKTRNYAIVFMTLLAAADAVVRIEKYGMNRRRWIALMLMVLASTLSHYFSIGAVLAIAIYAMLRLRGRIRLGALSAFAIAAMIFCVTWGPFFWRQRALLSVNDPAASFLRDVAPGHAGRVIQLFLVAPVTLLVARGHYTVPTGFLSFLPCFAGVLYVVPFAMLRRRPDLLLGGLWLLCTIGAVGMLDLLHSSLHMGFVRYVTMASPGVFLVVAGIFRDVRWLKHIVPAAMVIVCTCFVQDAYTYPATDPRDIAKLIQPKLTSADVIVFASPPEESWTRGTQYLMLSRYVRPIPCPVVFLDGPPTGAAKEQIAAARGVFIFTSTQGPADFLPGFVEKNGVDFSGWGRLTWMTSH